MSSPDAADKSMLRSGWDRVPASGDAELMAQIYITPAMEQRLLSIDFLYSHVYKLFLSVPVAI
jgi:hypothetical protein